MPPFPLLKQFKIHFLKFYCRTVTHLSLFIYVSLLLFFSPWNKNWLDYSFTCFKSKPNRTIILPRRLVLKFFAHGMTKNTLNWFIIIQQLYWQKKNHFEHKVAQKKLFVFIFIHKVIARHWTMDDDAAVTLRRIFCVHQSHFKCLTQLRFR